MGSLTSQSEADTHQAPLPPPPPHLRPEPERAGGASMMISSCAASCFIQFSHSILVASDFIFQKRGNIFSAIYNQRLQCTSRKFRHSLAKVRSRKGFQQVVRNNHMTNIFWAGIGRDNCGGCWTVNIVSTLPDSWEGRWKALRIYSQSK